MLELICIIIYCVLLSGILHKSIFFKIMGTNPMQSLKIISIAYIQYFWVTFVDFSSSRL